MRGKESGMFTQQIELRITPAHEGKSFSYRLCNSCKKDHPRTCGEKPKSSKSFSFFLGSPPHMRGKVNSKIFKKPYSEDHPRTCGEKLMLSESSDFR